MRHILFICFLAGMALLGAQSANAQVLTQRAWVLLTTVVLDQKVGKTSLQIPSGSARITAVRLTVLEGQLNASRLVIGYGNGQHHFEDRELVLTTGAQSLPIAERDEELVLDMIEISTNSAAGSVRIQVWGLSGPENQAAAAPPNVPFRPRGKVDGAPSPEAASVRGYTEIGIHYGTTRRRESDRVKNGQTLSTFSGVEGNALTLGRAMVTIPIEREVGSIPRPGVDFLIARISLRNEDPKRDFTIAAVDVLDRPSFIGSLNRQLALAKSFSQQALVFVHGYNVSFEDAIFRTAQIAHDIGFDGPAITFSWPSRGGALDYKHDVDTAKASRDALGELLALIANESGVSAINIVAHSMGNDPLLETLSKVGEIKRAGGRVQDLKIREIVLAAPDVSQSAFLQFASKIGGLASGGVTLYASAKDRALEASKRVAGGLVRAGDVSAGGPLVVTGIETIDVSDINTSFFSMNHSTFADRRDLVEDMRLLFDGSLHPPHIRFPVFRTQADGAKTYWRYLRN